MATVKKESKISQSKALEEANLLNQLLRQDSPNGANAGSQLCETYSAAPRKLILSELTKLAKKQGFDRNVLTGFLKTQLVGVKQQQADAYFTAILKTATANKGRVGAECVSDLILWIVELDRKLPKIASIDGLPKGLAIAFDVLCDRKPITKSQLNRWCRLSQPSMNCVLTAELKFSKAESGQILASASRLDRADLPELFYSCVPSLVLLAQDSSSTFLASESGQEFLPLFAALNTASSQEPELQSGNCHPSVTVVASPQEKLASLLKEVQTVFAEAQADFELKEEESTNNEIALNRRIKRLEKEVNEQAVRLKSLESEHEEALNSKESELGKLTAEKAAVEDAAKKLNADLQLTDANAAKDLQEQKFDIRNQIGQIVDVPIQTLVKDVQVALDKHQGNEDVENIAISFDALHRKLIKQLDLANKTRIEIND